MVFLELQREAGVCSRVKVREDIKNFVCSATSGLLSSYDGITPESKLGLAGQYGRFWR